VADAVDAALQQHHHRRHHKASSLKVAEAAKVIENTQRDLNIALVNELSVIFDRLGIDTLDVLEAAGSKWNFLPFRPGMVGGHCIGVDPYYLTHKAEEVGYHPQVILAGRRINDNMARYAARTRHQAHAAKTAWTRRAARWACWALPLKKTAPTFATAKWLTWCVNCKPGALTWWWPTPGPTPPRCSTSMACHWAPSDASPPG
jgi:UDP-N-acetyl-D-mannosaminuronate dehydrogenase